MNSINGIPIFKPTYNTIKIEEENNTAFSYRCSKNKRNSFLQNTL